jgi:DNA-binding CsgD family transcriptional regulator
MTVFQTEMHVVTLVFIVLEIFMFSFQLVLYLQKPAESKRKYYLILLFLLIIYNIAGGLFPDGEIPLPIQLQNILAYGAGFLMACYFPFYFYKAFDIHHLKFQAKYGVLIFLVLPFLFFFCILYPMGVDLKTVIYIGLIIPFFYAFYMIYNILWAIRKRFKDRKASFDAILSYAAVFPWALMPAMAYLEVTQLTEVLFTNGGFIIITVLFLRNMIEESRKDLETLELIQTKTEKEIFAIRCSEFGLTQREAEICELVREGLIYRDIADTLSISERTVSKHIQNIFQKAEVKNKTELINRLGKT